MVSILFVFILVRSPEPYVGAIARPRGLAVSLWSECPAHDERPKYGDRKCQPQKQSKRALRTKDAYIISSALQDWAELQASRRHGLLFRW
jgi:hypothetical protein